MYQPIRDYAAVGDTHTVALISSQGSIDWMCLPHFDGPAMFLRLLDDNKGGCCDLRLSEGTTARRRYLDRTNILETTFETSGGRLVVSDFMPVRRHEEEHWAGQ